MPARGPGCPSLLATPTPCSSCTVAAEWGWAAAPVGGELFLPHLAVELGHREGGPVPRPLSHCPPARPPWAGPPAWGPGVAAHSVSGMSQRSGCSGRWWPHAPGCSTQACWAQGCRLWEGCGAGQGLWLRARFPAAGRRVVPRPPARPQGLWSSSPPAQAWARDCPGVQGPPAHWPRGMICSSVVGV